MLRTHRCSPISLPHPPKLAGADSFQLFEHTAEIVQLYDAAFQTDFFYTFVGKPQHPLRMDDPHLLQVSNQRHTKAVRKIPNRVTTQASSWIGFIEFSQKFYLPILAMPFRYLFYFCSVKDIFSNDII